MFQMNYWMIFIKNAYDFTGNHHTIEEKRLKRKEAFKKELENRDARKALINRQGSG